MTRPVQALLTAIVGATGAMPALAQQVDGSAPGSLSASRDVHAGQSGQFNVHHEKHGRGATVGRGAHPAEDGASKITPSVGSGVLALAVTQPPAASPRGVAPVPGATPTQTPERSVEPGGTVQDVVITARRVEERLQDVPVAVTAISSEKLEARAINGMEALRYSAPSLQISPTSFGNAVPGYTIRSQHVQEDLITQDPAVGIYFAEQVQLRPHGTNQVLYDLASVEVLKGPQGTLFGRNTTGGAILINPQKPRQDFEGLATIEGGNYDLKSGTAVLNIPLSDTLAVRAAGKIVRRDGYVHNLTLDNRSDDDRNESARLSLLWSPTPTFTSYLIGNYFHENDAGVGYYISAIRPGSAATTTPGLPEALARQLARDIYHIENNLQSSAFVRAWTISDTSTLDINEATIKNIVGYRKVDSFTVFDSDGSPVTFFPSQNRLDANQFTEELQASGKALGDRLSYIAGLYYFREHGRDIQNSILSGATRQNDGEGTNKSYSAYAQFGYKLRDNLNLTVGGRYTIDNRINVSRNLLAGQCRLVDAAGVRLNPCIKRFETTFRSPTWLVSLDYKPTANTLVYLTHRRGYRSGGWNLRANNPTEQVPFKPEYVYDIELGLKTDLLDRHLRVNAAVYNQWYQDIQRTLSFGVPLATVVLNAGRATIKGGELEVTVLPAAWVELTGALSYSKAKYQKFTAPNLGDLSDNVFSQAPHHTYSGTLRFNLPVPEATGPMSIQFSYYHQSKIYINDLNQPPYPDPPLSGYGLLDITGDWRNVMGAPVDLRFFVKNVTGKQYFTGGSSVYASVGVQTPTIGSPRRFGISATYRFGALANR